MVIGSLPLYISFAIYKICNYTGDYHLPPHLCHHAPGCSVTFRLALHGCPKNTIVARKRTKHAGWEGNINLLCKTVTG